jgi:hypothetical protein
MSEDYLWDRSGKPDREVEKLEQMLGQFREDVPPPDFRQVPAKVRVFSRRRMYAWMAAAAAVVVVALRYANLQEPPALYVARLAGTPQIGERPIAGTDRMKIGQYLETDATSRARIDVGLIGEVDVEPNSRVGLLATRPTEHRLALDVGTLHARIWAPPGLFFVNTPSATAIDLGCTYTLTVDSTGAGWLHVTKGWVSFEHKGRESFVPEGAMCEMRPGIGPGTPYREDAPETLRAALDKFDFEKDSAALDGVLQSARKEDALTLWHLLARTSGDARARVFDKLAAVMPPSPGVTRDGIIAGDRKMLDRWWEELGLHSASWWRMWKGPAPQVR